MMLKLMVTDLLCLDCIHILANPKSSDAPILPNLDQQPSNSMIKTCSNKEITQRKSTTEQVKQKPLMPV